MLRESFQECLTTYLSTAENDTDAESAVSWTFHGLPLPEEGTLKDVLEVADTCKHQAVIDVVKLNGAYLRVCPMSALKDVMKDVVLKGEAASILDQGDNSYVKINDCVFAM